MKTKNLKISILILLVSILSCGFLFMQKEVKDVYAVEAAQQNCYYLMGDDGNPYMVDAANGLVGTVDGAGEFVVGSTGVVMTATAKENYQLVGWQIIYKEQGDRVQYVDLSGLDATNSKTIELFATDATDDGVDNGEIIPATLKFTISRGYAVKGTFALSYVFEDLTIRPVFDHIYYQVDVTSFVDLITFDAYDDSLLNGDVLYYSTSDDSTLTETDESTQTTIVRTKFENATLKQSNKYYYYGTVFRDVITQIEDFGTSQENVIETTKYYTVHNDLSENATEEKVDIEKGAYRINDEVLLSYDIVTQFKTEEIDGEEVVTDKVDFNNSVNIDLQGFLIVSNSTTELTEENFDIVQDEFYRTTSFDVAFEIEQNVAHINEVKIKYHQLYIADVNVSVDGNLEHDETNDVLGVTTVKPAEFLSNISAYNYYSIIDEDGLIFFIKQAQNNNSKAFGVVCSQVVSKTIENVTYNYYSFNSLDNQVASRSKYYANINQNIEIIVDYTSSDYAIQFETFEFVKDGNGVDKLIPFAGETLATKILKRGEEVSLNANSVQSVYNSGYRFVGFALDNKSSLLEEYSYTIDTVKPVGKIIYLCFEKVEFDIDFTNFNNLNIVNGNNAIKSVSFSVNNGATIVSETYSSTDLSSTDIVNNTIKLNNKIKLGGSVSTLTQVNNGFEILGYGVKSSVLGVEDYVVEKEFALTLNQDFISNYLTDFVEYNYVETNWINDWNNVYVYDATKFKYVLNEVEIYDENKTYYTKTNKNGITIFVYESAIKYTLTYIINAEHDNKLNEDVVMAQIDALAPTGAMVQKFALDNQDESGYKEISAENGNTSAKVAKIVISNLHFAEEVELTSQGYTIGTGTDAYKYAFAWFTEDGKSTLDEIVEGDIYSYVCEMKMNKTIFVVYSMPNTKVKISIDEEFAQNPNFNFDLNVENKTDTSNLMEVDANGFYNVEVGDVLIISVSNISSGYVLDGYIKYGSTEVKDINEEYPAVNGTNIITLKFRRIVYQFIFEEHGGGKNGETFTRELDIDNSIVEVVKPLGYYVSSVKFGRFDAYSENLSETNEDRSNIELDKYLFTLSREQFVYLTDNYSTTVETADGVVNVINVRFDYTVFTYNIEVVYGLTNSKGEGLDKVLFPAIKLTYHFNGEDYSFTRPYESKNVMFTGIQYGAQDTTIRVLSGPPSGLEVAGWFVGDNIITQEDYLHASNYIELGSIVKDLAFGYKLTYSSYYVNVQYNSAQGTAEMFRNGQGFTYGTSTIQVVHGDSLEIYVTPARSKGYKFSSISYKTPVYKEYAYDESTWEEQYLKLYLKSGENYVLNTSNVYDNTKVYYSYSTNNIVSFDIESVTNLTFKDDSFSILNYALEGQYIYFNVEFELVQITLSHTTEQIGSGSWSMTSAGSDEAKIEFNIDELAIYTVTASTVDYASTGYVTFNDTVTVFVEVNKNAINNVDGREYDLALGLKLESVSVSNRTLFGWSDLGNGQYRVVFNVGTYMSLNSEDVNIKYVFRIQPKVVNVTTVVDESSAEFYHNVNMFINAYVYGFARGPAQSAGDASLQSNNLQFLAKANIYSRFVLPSGVAYEEHYKNFFDVSGVVIYCNGTEIQSNDYANYGISISHGDSATTEDDWMVTARLMYNLDVVFKVQPKIQFNGGPNYSKEFKCDNNGNAIAQTLTVGSDATCDIKLANIITSYVKVTYKSTEMNSVETESVNVCGNYDVKIQFSSTESYEWLKYVKIEDSITLTITPKTIYLIYDEVAVSNNKIEKTYDGISDYDVDSVLSYFKFVDNKEVSISYADLLLKTSSDLKLNQNKTTGITAFISTDGADGRTALANENVYYNLYVGNIALRPTTFNSNFDLKTQELTINNYIKILKKEIEINLNVYNKVYDGTTNAEIVSGENIEVLNKIGNDDVVVNPDKLVVEFESPEVGTNKKVIVSAINALGGNDVDNYFIQDMELEGLTIYPNQLSAEIKGVGSVSLLNIRGLSEKDKVNLIPLNAVLVVEPIYADTNAYASIYNNISRYVKGNNEFSIGYKIAMSVNGQKVDINKNLHLSLPNVKNLTGVYFLTGAQSGEVGHDYKDGNILVDLQQIDVNVNSFFLTQKRILLKPWQIALIIIFSVLVIAAVVLTLIIVRKRKRKEYSVHEKI